MATYVLTPAEFDATTAKIAKINERAAKRGFTGRVDLVGAERVEVRHNDVTGEDHEVVWVDVEITGEAPSYGGWTFLAAVDTLPAGEDGKAGFILRYAPGVAADAIDRDDLVAGRCQHCHRDSTNRRYTYLVRHDDGRVRQVGSTCIKDFLGWSGQPVFIAEDELREGLEEAAERSFHEAPPMVPAEILAAAFAAVKVWGWKAASSWDGIPTAGRVQDYYFERGVAGRAAREAMAPHMEEGKRLAATVVATLRSDLPGNPGYEENLLVALGASYVTPRQVPLVASAISAYDRLMGRKAERAARPDRSQVTHLATVGAKVSITGIVTKMRECEGYQPGSVQFQVIVENATTVAVTWTTAAWAFAEDAPAVGDTVTLAGTVKKHDTFRDVPQTVLTRTKVTATTRPAVAA